MRKLILLTAMVVLIAGPVVVAAPAAQPNTGLAKVAGEVAAKSAAAAPAKTAVKPPAKGAKFLSSTGSVLAWDPATKTLKIKDAAGKAEVFTLTDKTQKVNEPVVGEKVAVHYSVIEGKNVAHSAVFGFRGAPKGMPEMKKGEHKQLLK